MHQTKRRITVTLEIEQAKALKNISKLVRAPVSLLVREMIGEAVLSFQALVDDRDLEKARRQIVRLCDEANAVINEVEIHDKNH